MRIRLKGINFATKRLADGTLRTYWYAWRGGPMLRGEPGTPEFTASYNAAVATKVVTPQGALLSVLQTYQASDDFLSLREHAYPSGDPLLRNPITGIAAARAESGQTAAPLSTPMKSRRAMQIVM